MDRRRFLMTSLAGAVAASLVVDAGATARIPRIDLLSTNARDAPDPAIDGFRQGLQELGYVEGRSIQLESR
jgi:hypothetical protein